MLLNIYNQRGQICGIYDTRDYTYHTKRTSSKGQIFLRKNTFNGQLKERAVAIDRNILSSLLSKGCKKVIFTILGLEKNAYSVWITPEDIATKGVKINYDKTNGLGAEYTGFGEQYVISTVSDCIRMDVNQLELNSSKLHRI